MQFYRKHILISLVVFFVIIGCQTKTDYKRSSSFVQSNKQLLRSIYQSPEASPRGNVSYELLTEHSFQLTRKESIKTDLFLPQISDRSPLIVISHGNKSYKEAHFKQAERLASWGFHVLTLQLPNQKQWVSNGKRIEKIVRMIHANPLLISNKIKKDHIILVGHSFGGSAVSVAAGSGAPVAALVLLDPAVVHTRVRRYLAKIKSPTLLIGADKKVFLSKRRNWFGKYIPAYFSELTVVRATHNDAQYPSLPSLNQMGFDSTTDEQRQEVFLKNILLGASLVAKNKSFQHLNIFLSKQQELGSITLHNSSKRLSLQKDRLVH